MRLKNKYVIRVFGLGLLILSGLLSCHEEIHVPAPPPGDRVIFNIEDGDFIVSRSAARNFPVEAGNKTFDLRFSSSANNAAEVFAAPGTRGVTYTSSDISSFNVTALTTDGNNLYFNDVVNVQNLVASSNRFWPAEALTFFAHYAPGTNLRSLNYSCADSAPKGEFSYALPAPTAEGEDAAGQKDMIFAISHDISKPDGESRYVPLKFHHALSALVFKLGKMPEGVSVRNIRLLNFHSGGTCVMVPEGTDNVRFSWTAAEDKKTYVQNFPESQVLSEERTFMMIPQSFTENAAAVLEINFDLDGASYTLKKPMNEIVDAIQADMKYVFSIGVSEVKVEILEDFDGVVKRNVHFKNTGNTAGYIRAAIVGYWVDDAGDIVAPWTDFIVPSTTSGWRYNDSDGFYYFKTPVAPGESTANLVESYSWNREPAVLNSALHLNIVAQIISEARFNAGAWGTF